MAEMDFHNAQEQQAFFGQGTESKEYTWGTKPDTRDKRQTGIQRYLHMTTNAGTGQVIDFHLQDDSERGKQGTVSREAACEDAMQLLQKYLKPDTADWEVLVSSSSDEMIPSWVLFLYIVRLLTSQ